MEDIKSEDTIQLKPEEFSRLENLNNLALRTAQDAEVIVQEQKLNVAKAQKEVRDYLFTLAERHPINPSANYELNRETKSLSIKR
jgi:hypothetical protein